MQLHSLHTQCVVSTGKGFHCGRLHSLSGLHSSLLVVLCWAQPGVTLGGPYSGRGTSSLCVVLTWRLEERCGCRVVWDLCPGVGPRLLLFLLSVGNPGKWHHPRSGDHLPGVVTAVPVPLGEKEGGLGPGNITAQQRGSLTVSPRR